MPHVLLVDDDDSFRADMARALEAGGFGVHSARDYRQALPILNSDAPVDLLVTDVVMPHAVNGFALARMGSMRRSNLKVLYITAFDVSTREAMGPVLRKPFVAEALVTAARAALAGTS